VLELEQQPIVVVGSGAVRRDVAPGDEPGGQPILIG
jgi:hypothetical protein